MSLIGSNLPRQRLWCHPTHFSPTSVQVKSEINGAFPCKRHQKQHLEFCATYLRTGRTGVRVPPYCARSQKAALTCTSLVVSVFVQSPWILKARNPWRTLLPIPGVQNFLKTFVLLVIALLVAVMTPTGVKVAAISFASAGTLTLWLTERQSGPGVNRSIQRYRKLFRVTRR